MELEFASIHNIADELANRGLQFVIAIEVINNNEPPQIHLCVDGKKDKMAVARKIAPIFEIKGHNKCSE
jgi:hypothetical protein